MHGCYIYLSLTILCAAQTVEEYVNKKAVQQQTEFLLISGKNSWQCAHVYRRAADECRVIRVA